MALMLAGVIRSLRARPRSAPALMTVGWAWAGANFWRALFDRVRIMHSGGQVGLGSVEMVYVTAQLIVALLCLGVGLWLVRPKTKREACLTGRGTLLVMSRHSERGRPITSASPQKTPHPVPRVFAPTCPSFYQTGPGLGGEGGLSRVAQAPRAARITVSPTRSHPLVFLRRVAAASTRRRRFPAALP